MNTPNILNHFRRLNRKAEAANKNAERVLNGNFKRWNYWHKVAIRTRRAMFRQEIKLLDHYLS